MVIAAYWRLVHCQFVNYDDPDYISNNPMVLKGLTLEGIRWAFTSFHAANWHPLTWLSHMLDCQLYGANPLGPHLTNLCFHILNTLLLFILFNRLTGAQWKSAAVAGLFAVHPIHVESVAWISERKDVLSTFLGLLSTWCYVRFAQKQVDSKKRIWYLGTLFCFALALLAKPMVVTLPFVWMLLDCWPLVRSWQSRLVFEKIPFLFLSGIACLLTLMAQQNAVMPMDQKTSLLLAVILAVQSYWMYIAKLFFPTKLAVLYPMPNEFHLWQSAVAAVALIGLSLLAVAWRRGRPAIVVGWLWFLGTLVPVVGFVKVGLHFVADRYTYIPSIGLSLVFVWCVGELIAKSKRVAILGTALFSVVGLILLVVTNVQLKYWSDSVTLFEHCLAVTENNAVGEDLLGTALVEQHRFDESKTHFERSIQLLSTQVFNLSVSASYAHNHLGSVYLREGDNRAAVAEYKAAVGYDPNYAIAYANLGEALLKTGELEESLRSSLKAISISSNNAAAFYNAGTVYVMQHQTNDAVAFFRKAVELRPRFPEAHNNLAYTLAKTGAQAEAETHYREAIRLWPDYLDARRNFGGLLLKQKRFDEATEQYLAILRSEPDNAEAHYQLGVIEQDQRHYSDAALHLRRAVELKPSWVEAINNLSWLLSTSTDATVRNGSEALKFARRLAVFTGDDDVQTLDTLAAAYAETGEFAEASQHEKAAIETLRKRGEPVKGFEQRFDLYQQHRPFRE